MAKKWLQASVCRLLGVDPGGRRAGPEYNNRSRPRRTAAVLRAATRAQAKETRHP